jgi:1,4-dihydroxy-2-naphthoyl-CoA hydrolase
MIWKHEVNIELLNQLSEATAVSHLGISFSKIGDDYLEASMPVDHRTIQPAGLLHGGASALLAETLGSVASSLLIEDYGKQVPVGIEINASHLKSVNKGAVIGRVSPIRIGKNVHVWQIEIRSEADQLICSSRLTVMLIKPVG